jgi:hypothetical protein
MLELVCSRACLGLNVPNSSIGAVLPRIQSLMNYYKKIKTQRTISLTNINAKTISKYYARKSSHK